MSQSSRPRRRGAAPRVPAALPLAGYETAALNAPPPAEFGSDAAEVADPREIVALVPDIRAGLAATTRDLGDPGPDPVFGAALLLADPGCATPCLPLHSVASGEEDARAGADVGRAGLDERFQRRGRIDGVEDDAHPIQQPPEGRQPPVEGLDLNLSVIRQRTSPLSKADRRRPSGPRHRVVRPGAGSAQNVLQRVFSGPVTRTPRAETLRKSVQGPG